MLVTIIKPAVYFVGCNSVVGVGSAIPADGRPPRPPGDQLMHIGANDHSIDFTTIHSVGLV